MKTDMLIQDLTESAKPALPPPLDPGFRPAALWNRAYRTRITAGRGAPIHFAITRPDGTVFRHDDTILPWEASTAAATRRYVERTVKRLLWQKGGSRVYLAGCLEGAAALAADYAAGGPRAFDADLMGNRVFGEPFRVVSCQPRDLPPAREPEAVAGGNWDGCRVGFDLGGSDRKCAAVIDGRVVHTEEVPWSPGAAEDWRYHRDGILDSLQRAAAHLPRVDAIGGSAAGIYVDNEARVASLFRRVPAADFDRHIRRLFLDIGRERGVPLVVMNDGDVTALAGSLATGHRPMLGMAFGTSLAGGYCSPAGRLTCWLNELAFVPIDFRGADAPRDEWSGDLGCGAQYLSQQAVGRLAAAAGVAFADGMGLPERLAEMQRRLAAGDATARQVFVSVGRYLGYAIAHLADGYDLRHILVLGRVTSGEAGGLLVAEAESVLRREFPDLSERVSVRVPGEQERRHGQAVVAASLPRLAHPVPPAEKKGP
jgi:predicted NBD/HSP70 family sugar kinase